VIRTDILILAFALSIAVIPILNIAVLARAFQAQSDTDRRARDHSFARHATRCLGRQRPCILLVQVLPACCRMSSILTGVRPREMVRCRVDEHGSVDVELRVQSMHRWNHRHVEPET